MRIYEELFIVRPDASDQEIDPLIEQITSIITGAAGVVEKTEKWGKRKLAYRVQKREEGFYILLVFRCGPEAVREIERRLRVSDLVLKFLTVRIDEKMKRIEKRKKAREKRAARKPAPVTAAPGSPSAAPGSPTPAGPALAGPAPGGPAPGAPVAPTPEQIMSEAAAEKGI